LPSEVRALADQAYARLKQDPRHPSLHCKKIGRFWSARVGATTALWPWKHPMRLSGSGLVAMPTTIDCVANNRIELTALRAAAHTVRYPDNVR
jgi:hypothetical protein